MIAFDTDIFTEILLGSSKYVSRAKAIPDFEQALPVIVVEEITRGRLHIIQQAEAGKAKINITRAYELFENTFRDLRQVQILPYTLEAEILYQQWRNQPMRIATHDLRIAAIYLVHDATLISRNRRDYERIPDLNVEFWD